VRAAFGSELLGFVVTGAYTGRVVGDSLRWGRVGPDTPGRGDLLARDTLSLVFFCASRACVPDPLRPFVTSDLRHTEAETCRSLRAKSRRYSHDRSSRQTSCDASEVCRRVGQHCHLALRSVLQV
jgi:hypothetical protein